MAKEGWNPGVLGIVAGRLLEELGQTVIVLNIEDGRAKGSARSVEAVDILRLWILIETSLSPLRPCWCGWNDAGS